MKLFFIDGKKAGESFVLTPPGISLGRELDNDLVLDSEGCSRYHAKIEWTDEGWTIKDLGSTNGSKVNGIKIGAPCVLRENDKIRIGANNLLFAENLPGASGKAAAPTLGEPDSESHGAPTLTEIDPAEVDVKRSPFSDFFSPKSKDGKKIGHSGSNDDIFSKKTPDAPSDKQANSKRKSQTLFYAIVVLAAVLLVSLFVLVEKILSEKSSKAPAEQAQKESGAPPEILYEKQIISPDNVFRYELRVRGGRISVTRDDLKCNVRFSKNKELSPEQTRNLCEEIKRADFFSLQSPQTGVSGDEGDEDKRLTVAYGKALNSVRVKNTFEPQPFKESVKILEDFSETVLNIPPISLSAEEMQEEAKIAFDKAEQLFLNYKAQDENLNEAIKRYQMVVEFLEYFEPKPAMYDKAFSQMQEAKRILMEEIKAHNSDAVTYQKKNDWIRAKDEYRKIMNKLDPSDKLYQQARDKVIRIETHYKIGK